MLRNLEYEWHNKWQFFSWHTKKEHCENYGCVVKSFHFFLFCLIKAENNHSTYDMKPWYPCALISTDLWTDHILMKLTNNVEKLILFWHQYLRPLHPFMAQTMQYAEPGTEVALLSLLNHRLFPVANNRARKNHVILIQDWILRHCNIIFTHRQK